MVTIQKIYFRIFSAHVCGLAENKPYSVNHLYTFSTGGPIITPNSAYYIYVYVYVYFYLDLHEEWALVSKNYRPQEQIVQCNYLWVTKITCLVWDKKDIKGNYWVAHTKWDNHPVQCYYFVWDKRLTQHFMVRGYLRDPSRPLVIPWTIRCASNGACIGLCWWRGSTSCGSRMGLSVEGKNHGKCLKFLWEIIIFLIQWPENEVIIYSSF